MSKNLTPSILIQVEELFKEKKWPIRKDKDSEVSLYNRFCKRLKLFEIAEQTLMIQLAYNFLRVPMNEYVRFFVDSFFCFEEELFHSSPNIFILRLIQPYLRTESEIKKIERPDTKSCDFLYHMLKDEDFIEIDRFDKVSFIGTIKKLKKAIKDDNYLIVFIDDFIGSGKTATDALDIYFNEEFNGKKLETTKVKIVTLVAQEQGIFTIKEKTGVDTYSAQIRQRGISDFFTNDEVADKIKTMKMMEERIALKNKEEYSLGFMQSEALVQMSNK